MFEKSYKPEAKITNSKLQQILKKKLQMVVEKQTQTFARYLIEPREEPTVTKGEFKQSAACKIVVRFMNCVGSMNIYSSH